VDSPGRDADLRLNRCVSLLHLSNWDAALASCTEALRFDAEMAKAHRGRAIALHGLGRLSESAEAQAEAVRLDPSFKRDHP
jgi:Tfp pilus assembly protein PilF